MIFTFVFIDFDVQFRPRFLCLSNRIVEREKNKAIRQRTRLNSSSYSFVHLMCIIDLTYLPFCHDFIAGTISFSNSSWTVWWTSADASASFINAFHAVIIEPNSEAEKSKENIEIYHVIRFFLLHLPRYSDHFFDQLFNIFEKVFSNSARSLIILIKSVVSLFPSSQRLTTRLYLPI